MLDWLFDDGLETVYGHGRSFAQAKAAAVEQLPDDGYVEVTEAAGIDLGDRERYSDASEIDMQEDAAEPYELKVVELEYWQDVAFDPDEQERYDTPGSLSGQRHPNDHLSDVEHPINQLP